MSEQHGERLASLEERTRYIQETLDRVSRTMEQLAQNEAQVRQAETEIRRLEDMLKSHDTDFTLVANRMDTVERDHIKLQTYVESRWWVLVTITIVASTVGGWLLQVAIRALF